MSGARGQSAPRGLYREDGSTWKYACVSEPSEYLTEYSSHEANRVLTYKWRTLYSTHVAFELSGCWVRARMTHFTKCSLSGFRRITRCRWQPSMKRCNHVVKVPK